MSDKPTVERTHVAGKLVAVRKTTKLGTREKRD
jgi:hypothetical protein